MTGFNVEDCYWLVGEILITAVFRLGGERNSYKSDDEGGGWDDLGD